MRYYTNELWNKINSESQEERDKAAFEWRKNDDEYCEIFHNLKKCLPKKFLKIYEQECAFHDYELKNLEVVHGKKGYTDPVEVMLEITNGENLWNIVYKKIKKISINYEQQSDIFNRKKTTYYGFDDYGYDEFFQVDEKTLSHEILFASGATILVHFEKISINKK